jgi:dienelactone hydrolase
MRAFLVVCLFALSAFATAAPRADKVTWSDGGKKFDGYLVWDDATSTKRPGLLMVPNWWGVTDHAIDKAKTIAGKDYVILLVDMYGRTPRPTNAAEAGDAAGAVYANPKALRSRIAAALKVLRGAGRKAPVDSTRIGAIGFCFGGAVALELARSGAAVAGVATFHANLATKQPAVAGKVRAPVLVMNGADDGFVSHESIDAFQKEMRDAGADWQFVNFGGAVHCFAEPDEHGAVKGCEFHEPSYRRSMAMMRGFFAERFAKQ